MCFFLLYPCSQDLLIFPQLPYLSFCFSQRYPGSSCFLPPFPEELHRPKTRTPKTDSRDDRQAVFRCAWVFCHWLLKSAMDFKVLDLCAWNPLLYNFGLFHGRMLNWIKKECDILGDPLVCHSLVSCCPFSQLCVHTQTPPVLRSSVQSGSAWKRAGRM